MTNMHSQEIIEGCKTTLATVAQAFQLSAHILVQDYGQLTGQLAGRLLSTKSPGVQEIVQKGIAKKKTPWLRPLTPSLTPPGGPLIRTLEGHTDEIDLVAVTPNGRHIVSRSHDNSFKVWNLESGELIRTLDRNWEAIAIAITDEGIQAISVSDLYSKTFRVWDMESGELLCTFEGHTNSVVAVAVTPDGRCIVSGSHDKTIRVWDLKGGELIRTLEGHTSTVETVAITPDGCRAVSGSQDNTLKVWDLESGEILHTLEGESYRGWFLTVAVTPDGKRAVAGSGNKLWVWDLESGELLRILEGHTDTVEAVAVTPDGQQAVSASDDKTIKIWDLENGELLHTLAGHTEEIYTIAVTPDGRYAVSGSVDGTLKVWDLQSGGNLLPQMMHSDWVNPVVVTPDGRRTVSGSGDKTIKVWGMGNGELLHTLEGHTEEIYTMTVTQDSRLAISGSTDMSIRVWDLESGNLLHTLESHTRTVREVAVTHDGSHLVSASNDETLMVWDLKNGERLHTMEGHTNRVTAVAVTPDGSRAISGSADRTIRMWDLLSGECISILEGHKGDVTTVVVTPDGQRAVTGSYYEKTLRVWDLESGELLNTLEGHIGEVIAVAVTPDGQRAVSGSDDMTLRVWDLESGKEIALLRLEDSIRACAVTPDGMTFGAGDLGGRVYILGLENLSAGALIVTARRTLSQKLSVRCPLCNISFEIRQANLGCDIPCPDCGIPLRVNPFIVDVPETRPASRVSTSVKEVDRPELDTGSRRLTGHQDDVLAISLTPDGHFAVSGSSDNTLKVWDLQNGEVLRTLEGHLSLVGAVAVTPNGKRAVSGSRDHTIKVWDLQNGELLQTLKHTNSVNAIAVTPDGTHLVAGSGTRLRVWDLRSGEKLYWGGYHLGTITAVALTSDGTRAVSGSLDKTIRVWDMEYWDELHTLKGHKDRVTAVAVTPDDTRVVSASFDGTLKVWNLQTGELLRTLEGHTSHINTVVVTPDGACAISGSWDNTIRMWDLESGENVRTLEGHTRAVWSVAVTSDGRRVVSGSRDKTIRVWDLPIGDDQQTLEKHTCAVIKVQEDQKKQVPPTDEDNIHAQADHLRRKGEQLLNSRELAQAVDCFDQALDLLPDDLTLLDLKARTLLESGDIQGGLDVINHVRNKDLASKDYLGKLYGAVGFALGAIGGEAFEDAVEYYQMASALVPGDWDVWYYQGLANYRMGYYEDALDCLQRAKEIDDNEETNLLINSCYEEIEELNLDRSIIGEEINDVTHHHPSPTSQTVDELYKKGTQLFNSGDFEGALNCFDLVLKQQPENSEAWILKLSALLQLGRREKAVQSADHVLENHLVEGEHLATIYLLKGSAQIGLKQFTEGLGTLEECLKLDDKNITAWTIRAQAYSEIKDYQGALESYLRVRELEWSEETEAMIGMCYLHLDDTESAEAVFKSLVEGDSQHPLTFYGYGLCLIMMDKPEQGCKWLRRFLDDPGEQYQPIVPQAQQVVDRLC